MVVYPVGREVFQLEAVNPVRTRTGNTDTPGRYRGAHFRLADYIRSVERTSNYIYSTARPT